MYTRRQVARLRHMYRYMCMFVLSLHHALWLRRLLCLYTYLWARVHMPLGGLGFHLFSVYKTSKNSIVTKSTENAGVGEMVMILVRGGLMMRFHFLGDMRCWLPVTGLV